MWFADKYEKDLKVLGTVLLGFGATRKRTKSHGRQRFGHIRRLLSVIMPKCPPRDKFEMNVAITLKIGHATDILKMARDAVTIPGTNYHLIPSLRNVQRSSKLLRNGYIVVCKPEITFSGFRCDLVKSVTFANKVVYGEDNLDNCEVDVWGDGCDIGGSEQTRLCFRILRDTPNNVTSQSATTAFCFGAFRGKDSRFVLEQNIGPTIVGDQTSGWLYSQTKQLSQLGVRVTYSGDSPFLNRLILGTSSDACSDCPSKLSLYVGDNVTYLPTKVHDLTCLRSDVNVPFRQEIPTQSLVYLDDIRCVFPDATHMITRCVESDLRKIAQFICNKMYPYEKVIFQFHNV